MTSFERQKVGDEIKRVGQVVRETPLEAARKQEIVDVYLKRTQDLLDLVDSLDANDPLRQTVLRYLLDNLARLDKDALIKELDVYRERIDQFYREVLARKEKVSGWRSGFQKNLNQDFVAVFGVEIPGDVRDKLYVMPEKGTEAFRYAMGQLIRAGKNTVHGKEIFGRHWSMFREALDFAVAGKFDQAAIIINKLIIIVLDSGKAKEHEAGQENLKLRAREVLALKKQGISKAYGEFLKLKEPLDFEITAYLHAKDIPKFAKLTAERMFKIRSLQLSQARMVQKVFIARDAYFNEAPAELTANEKYDLFCDGVGLPKTFTIRDFRVVGPEGEIDERSKQSYVPGTVLDNNLEIPLDLHSSFYKRLFEKLEYNQLYASKEAFLRTHDPKYEKSARKFFEVEENGGVKTADCLRKQVIAGADIAPDVKRRVEKAMKSKMDKTVKDFSKLQSDLAKADPYVIHDKSREFYLALSSEKKDGVLELAKLIDPRLAADNPGNKAILDLYENFTSVYMARTVQLSQDAMTKHPKILADIADVTSYMSDASGFMEATMRTFKDMQKTGEGIGDQFLGGLRYRATQLYHDPRREKIYSKLYGKPFFDAYKTKSAKDSTEFDRQMEIVWSGMSKMYKEAPRFASDVGRLCSKVMKMEGDPSTFLDYLESMRGPIIITAVACAGAIAGGYLLLPLLAKGGALASAGFLTKLVATSITTGVTAGIGSMAGVALVTGRVDHMDSWQKNLLTLGQSVGMQALAGVGGAVLGRGMASLGKVIANKSPFWGTRVTAYAKNYADVMLARSVSVRTGGFFSRFKDFFVRLGEETSEELLEDMFETVGKAISADNPVLGFVCMLIPSSTRTARGVFLQSNGKFTAAPGVDVHVTERGLDIQYGSIDSVLALLRSKKAPAQLIASLEQGGEVDADFDGVRIRVKPTPAASASAAPVAPTDTSRARDTDVARSEPEPGDTGDIGQVKTLADTIRDKGLRLAVLDVVSDIWSNTKEGLVRGVQKLDKIYEKLKASGAWELLGKIADKIDEKIHRFHDATTAFNLMLLFAAAGIATISGLFIYLSTRYDRVRKVLRRGEMVIFGSDKDWVIENPDAHGRVLIIRLQPIGREDHVQVIKKIVSLRELLRYNPEIWDRTYVQDTSQGHARRDVRVDRSADRSQRRHEGNFNNKLNPKQIYIFSVNRPVVLLLAIRKSQRVNLSVLEDGSIVLESNGKRHVVRVGEEMLFGRADFDSNNDHVSAQHVRIKNLGDGKFELEDWNSKNGTKVESVADGRGAVDQGARLEGPFTVSPSLAALFAWLDSQGTTYSGMPVEKIKANIIAYIQGNGSIAPDGIPRMGDLRQKAVDILTEYQRDAVQSHLQRSKVTYDVSNTVSRVEDANSAEIEDTISRWLGAKSADTSHGVIVDDVLANNFRRGRPQKFEIRFRNGTTVKLIFPARCGGEMARIQSYVAAAEQWIQLQFGQYGVKPRQNLTILLMDDVPGHGKSVRGHAGRDSIIMRADSIGTQRFYETYFHERTHSILGAHNMWAHDGGVVEGIANYMAADGVKSLGFVNPEVMKISGRRGRVADAVLDNVRSGMSYFQALKLYFEQFHNKTDYDLNYEYGQAFTAAFIEHFHGNIAVFLELYAALGKSEFRSGGRPVNEMYAGAMRAIGLSSDDITSILHETAGKLMLRAHKGQELFDMIISQSPSEIHAILDQQSLATIFGLDSPTLAELEAHVEDAKRYVHGRRAGRASIQAFIQILDVKLGEIKSSRGMGLRTQMRYE
ncbi:FHA domain-containing protein [Candidatus Peregrinibacteria bacterium]|nr:FHA domain-containing protein [Candidatus Peregrinibacteria bacterium]